MDPRQVAVLIGTDGVFEDKTGEVTGLRFDGGRVHVTYAGQRTYGFAAQRVLVLDNPQVVAIGSDVGVAVDGEIWNNITEARYFTGAGQVWWHLFYGTAGKCAVRSGEQVEFVRNGAFDVRTTNVLQYWRAVAALLPDESRSLREGFAGLTFVHPDSALHRFLEGGSIDVRKDSPSPPIYPFHTNLSQREAIDNALHHPISVIDGPPGTGKTQTILNLIANILVDESRTVAVVSSNNAAVENVRDKLAEAGLGYVAADLGRAEKRAKFLGNQAPRNQVVAALRSSAQREPPSAERLVELDRRLRGLQETERELAQLRSRLAAFELERRHFNGYFERHELPELDQLPVLRWSAAKILVYIGDTDPELVRTTGITLLWDRMRKYFKYRSMRHVDAGDVEIVLRLQRVFYDKKIAELEREIEEVRNSLTGARFERLAEEQRTLSVDWLGVCLRQRYARQAPRTYDKGYRSQWGRFSHDYPVILSTCHSLERSIGKGRLLDYLIIDEASQVDLLAAGIAMACCRNLIVVGDLRQLQFIDNMPEQLCPPAPAPAYNCQQHSILASLIELYGAELPRVMLQEHYRCDPAIIGFCNKKFYDEQLIPFTSSQNGYQAMVVARTVAGNHMRWHDGGGRTNQREIDVIRREVLPQYCADFPNQQIGITTPYRKQANKAADQLIAAIEADTVHSFQGREKDAIVMTTVLDEREASQSGKGGLEFADQPQLVNVAVSRAKRRFVLVTNHDMLPGSRHLRDLIGYIRYHNPDKETFDSSVVSVFDLLYQEYSARLRPLANRLRNRTGQVRSEVIMQTVLEDLLHEDEYRELSVTSQVLLMNLLPDTRLLTEEQRGFVRRRASIDFVVYNRVTNLPLCAIEVDGFAYHENNPLQLSRDALKDSICNTYRIPLLRFPTTGSDEVDRLRREFNRLREQAHNPPNPPSTR
ncbi:AAA domain-containing protein [Nocardia sp. NPDC004604]|uniref:AAA domain-containing protein n=1 Tax=Nocardia sp. NPDC004604 TaxID=3157013 RepID=UPI0033A34127